MLNFEQTVIASLEILTLGEDRCNYNKKMTKGGD